MWGQGHGQVEPGDDSFATLALGLPPPLSWAQARSGRGGPGHGVERTRRGFASRPKPTSRPGGTSRPRPGWRGSATSPRETTF